MFLHLSVSHSVQRGEVSVPACTTCHMTRGVSVQGSLCVRGPQFNPHWRYHFCVCGRVPVWGGSLSKGLYQGEPPDRPPTVTCGRYASYWNAFLLTFLFMSSSHHREKVIFIEFILFLNCRPVQVHQHNNTTQKMALKASQLREGCPRPPPNNTKGVLRIIKISTVVFTNCAKLEI